jgi:MFS family permease
MILSAVFLIGYSTLAFEVLLTRIFSIGQWNHLSFMVISIALFGFAASGTFLSILSARRYRRSDSLSTLKTTAALVVLYAGSTIAAFLVLNHLPLDYFRLPVEPVQSLYLLIAFITLALPFFVSGCIVATAYTRLPEKTGLIYFATMCGSACGAVSPALLLPFFSEGKLVIFFAVIPLILLPAGLGSLQKQPAASKKQKSTHIILAIFSLVVIGLAVFLVTPQGDFLIRVKPSPYKTLSQVLQFPQTRIEQTISTIRGRIDRITSPYIRFAPGLSLRYMQAIETQDATYKDGDNQLVLFHPPKSPVNKRFSEFTLAYSGYRMRPKARKALVILQGGGTAVPCALTAGIPDITIVVENPPLADIVSKHYSLAVTSRAPRAFISQTRERYDIIQVENWGNSIPGSTALTQDHLYTTDAFIQYLQHLTREGLVIISRRLLLPPADTLRLWSSAYEGLKMMGHPHPESHLAILRNWDTFTLLVSNQPLENTDRLEKFAENRNFDIVFLPDMTSDQANRYNKFDAPYHFIEINRLASAYRNGRENAYFRSYLLDIKPQTDNRPFPGRYLKWPKIIRLYQTLGSRLYALLMSGEIVVSVVFIEALMVSGFLLFLPLLFIRQSDNKPTAAQIVFFLGVGAGFMFIELFFIKKYILLFGDPVISFTVVIAGVLIFSSFGGAWAQKKDKSVLKTALFILIGLLLLVLLALDPFVGYLLRFSEIWQYCGALLVLLPIGFLMGLPFTFGMREMLSCASQRAYAWSANGCASVLTSIVSAQIALAFGISFIIGCALVSYLVVIYSWRLVDRVS